MTLEVGSMKAVLFRWCGDPTSYVDAFASAGPVRVVGRSDAPIERDPGFIRELAAEAPDVFVIAGWGRVLGAELLGVPALGALNVHPSLLPSYRGRHPIFWTLLHGETESGVTIHRMTDAIDDGPILRRRSVAIHARADAVALERSLDVLGAELLRDLLADTARRGRFPEPMRVAGEPSSFPPVSAAHGTIDWTRTATEIDRLVRACAGTIEAIATFQGMPIAIVEAAPLPDDADRPSRSAPGQVIAVDDDAIAVATGAGAFGIRRAAFMRRVFDPRALAAILSITLGDAFD